MKNQNSFIGQIDLLALLGAEIKKVDSLESIVIPLNSNPSIEIREKKDGGLKAQMGIMMKETDGRYGNSHFVSVLVSKLVLEEMSMTYPEARQFCPILGNVKPFVKEERVEEAKSQTSRRNYYRRPGDFKRKY